MRSSLLSPWWRQHFKIKKGDNDERALIVIISLVETVIDMKKKTTTMNIVHCHSLPGVAHHNFFKMMMTTSYVHSCHLPGLKK
jgi:hypothetical protein